MKLKFGAIAAPLFFELGIGMAVGMLGTSFAAHISDAAGGAFALSNHLFGLLFMVFRLVGAGIGVVVSQNLGAQHRGEADLVARAALAAGTWMGGSMAVVALLFARPLLQALNAPPDVLALAVPLLQALSLALLLDAWNACMASVMRAHLRTRETMWVMGVMHVVHVGLAWPLMHGVAQMPGWGLPGFAMALVVSRIVGLYLHGYLWRRQLNITPLAADFWRVRMTQMKHILHIGLPGAAENLSWELAFMVSVAAVGVLGTQALATQAYVLQFNMWILMSGAAIGMAVEMVVGHLVGARKLRDAHVLVKRAQSIGLAVTLVVAVLMAWKGASLLRWFTDDPEILQLGQQLFWWSILLETGRTFNLIVISALRATGDSRYPFYAGVGSMAMVLAGGSWLLGVHWGWGLTGVWIAYAADEWIRGLMMWHRWVTRGWIPHARATHARMRHQANT
jgi:putative MATE family efflux protein